MMMDTTRNRAIAEQVFDYLISIGYTPYDISYGDSYFIFSMGADSVVHFRVKGVSKHWLFGMWINGEKLSMAEDQRRKETSLDGVDSDQRSKVVQLFAQYDTCIDKFKPSRSDLLVDMLAIDWLEYMVDDFDPEAMFWHTKDMLDSMRHHPLLCYAGVIGDGGVQHLFPGSFLWYFIKNEGRTYYHKYLEKLMWLIWVPYTYIKCAIAEKSSCIDHIRVEDFEKEHNLTTSYRYGIWITFAKDAQEEQMEKWASFWFRKNRYGKFDYYYYMIELQPWRQIGRKGMWGWENT